MTSARRRIFTLLMVMFSVIYATAQTAGDYRTKANGNWTDGTAVWQKYDGASWLDEAAAPTNADGIITVLHTITLDASTTVDDFVIDAAGVLDILSGVTLTIADGAAATDATVNGTLANAGTITTTGVLALSATGIYEHKHTTIAGTIPTATWDAASTCKVTGYTTYSGTPGGQNQNFGNFEWNCPLQQNTINNNTANCYGNFSVVNTGTGTFFKTANLLMNSASTFTVGANAKYDDNYKLVRFTVAGGSYQIDGYYRCKDNQGIADNGASSLENDNSPAVAFGPNAVVEYYLTNTQNLRTNVPELILGGNNVKSAQNDFTISESLTINAGVTLNVATRTITLNGNLVQNGLNTGTTGKILLTGGTAAHDISGSGSLLNVVLDDALGATLSSDMTISTLTLTNGNFNVGNHTLTLNNPIAGTATNLILTNQSNLVFSGMANADIPSNVPELNDLYVDVTGTLSLNADLIVNGDLTLQNGALDIGNHKLTVKGNIIYNTGTFATNANSEIEIAGTTAALVLTANPLNTLTVNNPNGVTWNGGTVNTITISNGTLTLGTGDVSITGNWANSGGFTHNNRMVTFAGSATQTISGTNVFYNLIVNNTHATNFVDASGSTLSVENLFDLQDGQFRSATAYADVTIAAATTFDLTGDITVSGNWTNNGGTFNHNNFQVQFNGNAAQNITGSASTSFYDLEIANTSGGVTLGIAQNVSNTLTLTSGRIFLGANNLNLTATATAIGGAPSAVNMVVCDGAGALVKYFNAGITNYVFPIGDNSGAAEYSPAQLTVQGNDGGAYIAVRVTDAKEPNDNSTADFISRYWTISHANVSNARNWDFTFTYVPVDENGTAANIVGAYYDGAAWNRGAAVGGNQFNLSSGNVSDWGASSTFAAIDGDAPEVSSVTPTPLTITDSEAGGDNFSIAVTFDEVMNTAVIPTISFPTAGEQPDVLGAIAFASGAWSNANKTYTATYTVTDVNANVNNIDVRVTGGQDAAGNNQTVTYNAANNFNLKQTNATITALNASVATIEDATAAFSITMDFSEAMNPAFTPSITFPTEVPTTTITTSTSSWLLGNTRFVQNYTIADNDDNIPNIDVRITAAKDTYGNDVTQKDQADFFNIDMNNAAISALNPTVLTITDGSGATFKLTATFNKNMNTGVNPIVAFPTGGENPLANTLTINSYNWLNAQNCEIIYDVLDANEEIANIDVRITAAQDLIGNTMTQYDGANQFSIDTKNATASSVTLNADPITEANPAGNLTITITYNEQMDGGTNPTITFPDENPFSTITEAAGSWSDAFTFVRQYTITDADQDLNTVDIQVSGAKDLAGNNQNTYSSADYFAIDMKNPTVSSVVASTATVTDGTAAFSITVNFDEPMNPGFLPTIAFPTAGEDASTTLSTSTTNWPTAQQFVQNYTMTDNDDVIPNIDVRITGAKDVNGNLQVQKDQANLFNIDMGNATVTTLTPAVATVTDNTGGTFKLTATFSKNMNTGVNPTVSFPTGGENPAATLTGVSYNWLNALNCEIIYTVDNSANEEISNIDVRITGAQDASANPMTQYDEANVFSIDTKSPSVSNITINADPVTDSNPGVNFTVTIDFDENMLNSSTPIITFPVEVPTSTLTQAAGSWTDIDTYVRNFTVTDANQELANIDLQISGAKDVAGNTQNANSNANYFSIDNKNPTVSSVAVNLATITDSDAGAGNFTIDVTYNEPMITDGSANPTITFPVESPGATLTFAGPGSWAGGNVYTATYNVADANMNVANIDIQITGAKDAVGNTQVAKTEANKFHIDMSNPALTTLTIASNNANNTALAKVGDLITINFTVNKTLSAMPVVTVMGNAATETSLGGLNYKAEYTMLAGDADGVVAFQVDFTDTGGNNGTANQTNVTDASSVTFDKTPPASNLLAAPATQYGGSSVAISASGLSSNKVWFAVAGKTLETQFTENTTMTKAVDGLSTTILAPADNGTYHIYVIDEAGNVSAASPNALTVDNTPLLANLEVPDAAYSEGNAPLQITNTITLDDDSDVINSATISISNNFATGQDVLSFTNTANITGAWNATLGVMTLSGNDSKVNYMAAIRAVRYENTSENPTANTRTISFRVNDGFVNSNTLTRDVVVTAVNDNPIITSTPITVGRESELYTYNLSATDVDHLPADLNFTALAAPAWLVLTDNGNGTATLQGTPPDGNDANVSIQVDDGAGGSSAQNFLIIMSAFITVDDDGGGVDYTTISDAIAAAVDGDKIRVNNGTYAENIDFAGKNIELIGNVADPAQVIIDGGGSGSVVTFKNNEPSTAVLNGFTIQNGTGTNINLGTSSKHSHYGNYGGGIYIDGANPTLRNLIVRNNAVGFDATHNVGGSGGGIYICNSAAPTIIDSEISNNSAGTYRGGGVCIDKSSLTLQNVDVITNSAGNYGGGMAVYNSTVNVSNNSDISNNQAIGDNGSGGGIFMIQSILNISNTTINGNTSKKGSSGIEKYDATVSGSYTGTDPSINL